jgi:hypothetical protein
LPSRHVLSVLVLLTVASCTPSEPGFFDRPMAPQAPTIERTDAIPVGELSTSEAPPLDESTPCDSIPAAVVAPAGFTSPPVANQPPGCVWLSPRDLVLTVSSMSQRTMAEQVTAHLEMSPDTLAHLTRLRIDGHYVIERILASDAASTCFLIVDVSAPQPVEVQVYRLNAETGEPVAMPARKAAEAFCPVGQEVALNLLRHLDEP